MDFAGSRCARRPRRARRAGDRLAGRSQQFQIEHRSGACATPPAASSRWSVTSTSASFPGSRLRTGEGRFGNAPGFGPEPMVTLEERAARREAVPAAARRAGRGPRAAQGRRPAPGAPRRRQRELAGPRRRPNPPTRDAEPMKLHIDGVEHRGQPRARSSTRAVPRRVEVTGARSNYGRHRAGRAVHRHRDCGRAAHGRVRAARACRSGSRCPRP